MLFCGGPSRRSGRCISLFVDLLLFPPRLCLPALVIYSTVKYAYSALLAATPGPLNLTFFNLSTHRYCPAYGRPTPTSLLSTLHCQMIFNEYRHNGAACIVTFYLGPIEAQKAAPWPWAPRPGRPLPSNALRSSNPLALLQPPARMDHPELRALHLLRAV